MSLLSGGPILSLFLPLSPLIFPSLSEPLLSFLPALLISVAKADGATYAKSQKKRGERREGNGKEETKQDEVRCLAGRGRVGAGGGVGGVAGAVVAVIDFITSPGERLRSDFSSSFLLCLLPSVLLPLSKIQHPLLFFISTSLFAPSPPPLPALLLFILRFPVLFLPLSRRMQPDTIFC